ncbi:MAG: S-layer homology domain-containing protein [Chloroflexota bacterium]
MLSSGLQRGVENRHGNPRYLARPIFLVSVLILISVALLPSGASGAPAASRQPTGSGTSSSMPLVTGSNFTMRGTMFQSDGQGTKERSLKDNLTIPAGSMKATFLSDPTRASMDFSDVAPHWWVDQPDNTEVLVELRTGPDGIAWSDWQAADEEDIIMAEDSITLTYASLISVGQDVRTNRYVQSRMTLHTSAMGITPTFHELTYTFINAGITPNPPKAQLMQQGTPADIPKPQMVSRESWGSPQGKSSPKWTPTYKRVTHIVVHHTATSNKDTDFAARVRAIWFYHANTRGWGDIGYNFLVDPNGVIYEGRAGGDDVEAGHAYPFNKGTMGIGMIGNFMTVAPTAAAQAALINLISWKASQRGIDPKAVLPITGYSNCGGKVIYNRPTIAGHRDYAGSACGKKFNTSTCPGDRLWDMLPQIRDAVVSEQPPLRANFIQHDTPGNIEPGATVDVRMLVHNSGSLTWTSKGQGAVMVGYRWMSPDNQPVRDGWQDIKTTLPQDVAFADTLTITAKLNAPNVSGHYALVWDMYRDGQGWFSDSGSQPLRVDVVVGKDLTDKTPPASEVLPLPVYSNDPELAIRWAGEDNPQGSGLASFDIQYRIMPNGPWTDWKTGTNQTQATYDGEDSYTYEFRSRARDAAGNVEEWPEKADTYTTVDTRPPPLIIEDPTGGDHVMPGDVVVRGRTEPGTFVAVNDKRAEENNGVFTSTVKAEGRDFLIHVSASDPSGNVSRLEVTVQAAPRYNDVPLDSPASRAIEYLSDAGILNGYSDGSFRPDTPVTRAQLAKMLVVTMHWGLIKPVEPRFTDVPADSPMFPYIETVAARGAMSGYMDGTFEPNLPVSRRNAVSSVLLAAGKTQVNSGTLLTNLPPGHWAAVCDVNPGARGNAKGDDSVTPCGTLPTTRADISLLVYNLRIALEKSESTTPSDDNGQ